MAKVIVKFKDIVRKQVVLQKETTTIGRTSTNDIPVENLAISRHHAEITRDGGRYRLRDLQSSNGTFVNGARVTEKILQDGDAILIGKHTLLFIENDDLAATVAAAPQSSQDPDTFLRSTMEWEITIADAEAATLLHAPAPQQTTAVGSLLVRAGELARERYPLTGEATIIGSAPYADVRLTAPNAPAVAVVIHRHGADYSIAPSEPGVLLNKSRLIRQQPLTHGALIAIQGVLLECLLEEKQS
ncbi:MAG: FHA domain-containing protein [Magnetococcus sp. YQC-3]